MKRIVFFLLISVLSAKNPLFVVLTKADTNYILLTETPKRGAIIYRKGPGENEFKEIARLKPASTPEEVRMILGSDYDRIAAEVGALNEIQLLTRLKYSSFKGGVMSFINLKVARLLGRIYKDFPIKKGETYTYKVEFLGIRKVKKTDVRKHRAVEILPEPPKKIEAESGDRKIILKWQYRKWQGNYNDLVAYFNIYRTEKGGKDFTKVNPYPILRENEGKHSYTDVWVENGKTYIYYITSVDIIGRESKASSPIEVQPRDKTPPSPPTGLVVIDHNGKAYLKWNMSLELDVAGYFIYRNTHIGEKFKKLNTRPIPYDSTVYIDSTAIPGRRYFYAVSAIDSSGNEGKKSNSIMVIIKDSFPPDPPRNVRAYYKNGKIYISWEKVDAPDLMGYYIYRGTIKKMIPKIIPRPLPPKTTSYIDKGYGKKGFHPGWTYFVGVTSVDSSRNESKLNLIKVVVPDSEPPIPPPLINVFNLKDGKIRVTFTPSPSLDVGVYRIYRVSGKKRVKLIELPKDQHKFVDSTAKVGLKFIYEVTAVDTNQNESKPTRSKEIFVKERIPPDPPSNAKAVTTDKGILITWSGSKSEDVAGYFVYRSKLPNGVYKKLNPRPTQKLQYIDKSGRKDHFYRVSAVDYSGNEAFTPVFQPVKK